jgi:tRNA A-37 threonylcarbamoyl transferase component Bud32/tetratricopeptide (TPR) repeat protein
VAEPLERLTAALADRYRIERELGAGGMATVYLAEDLKHHRKVAVKVLRPELAASLGPERFLREVTIAASLQHPHILPLYDSGHADGLLYYVMPYVEGISLRQKLIREGELPIPEATRILRDLADALAYAHQQGVVHRDIKPENVMLVERHALVMDFGVAKALAAGKEGATSSLTSAGVALGTPAYMAPEQAAGDAQVDHRADLYAWGIVAYEGLTGQPPFIRSTPQNTLAAQVTAIPESVVQRRANVPSGLARLVMQCLEKKAADRPQTAEVILRELDLVLTPSGGMTPTNTLPVANERPVRAIIRSAGPATVLGLLGLVAIGAAIRWWPHGRPALNAREPIVVVPFAVDGSHPSLASIGVHAAAGMSDAITRAGLSRVVVYAGPRGGGVGAVTPAIGERIVKATGAATFVTGTIYERRDSFDIRVRLLRASDLKPLWILPSERGAIERPDAGLSATTQRVLGAVGWYLTPTSRHYDVTIHAPPADLEQMRMAINAYEHFLLTSGLDEETKVLLREVINRDSSFTLAYQWLAASYANSGDGRRADSVMAGLRARRSALAYGDALRVDWLQAGTYGSPEEEYRVAVAGFAADSVGWRYMALKSSVAGNRLSEALGHFVRRDTSLVTTRTWPVWYANALLALHALGRFDQALQLSREARRLQPQWYGHLESEAANLVAMGYIEEAEQLITQAYDYPAPLAPGILMAYSIAPELHAHGWPNEAAAMWGRALEWFDSRSLSGPDEDLRRLTVARLCYHTGQLERARGLLSELATMDPENYELLGYQGLVAAAAGDTTDAERFVAQLTGNTTPWLRGRRLLWGARLYAAMGDGEAAVTMLREALNHGARLFWGERPSMMALPLSHYPEWARLKGYEPFEQLVKPKE